jgi:hypothetical protein
MLFAGQGLSVTFPEFLKEESLEKITELGLLPPHSPKIVSVDLCTQNKQ